MRKHLRICLCIRNKVPCNGSLSWQFVATQRSEIHCAKKPPAMATPSIQHCTRTTKSIQPHTSISKENLSKEISTTLPRPRYTSVRVTEFSYMSAMTYNPNSFISARVDASIQLHYEQEQIYLKATDQQRQPIPDSYTSAMMIHPKRCISLWQFVQTPKRISKRQTKQSCTIQDNSIYLLASATGSVQPHPAQCQGYLEPRVIIIQ